MLTHEAWVNAGWDKVMLRAPPPANLARRPTGFVAGRAAIKPVGMTVERPARKAPAYRPPSAANSPWVSWKPTQMV